MITIYMFKLIKNVLIEYKEDDEFIDYMLNNILLVMIWCFCVIFLILDIILLPIEIASLIIYKKRKDRKNGFN